MAKRQAQLPSGISDEVVHLAVREHIAEAGRLIIAWCEADLHRFDDLSDLYKLAIQIANPMGLRRLEARLTDLEREEHKEQRRHIKTAAYPTHTALADW
jgi:hypothetical protein